MDYYAVTIKNAAVCMYVSFIVWVCVGVLKNNSRKGKSNFLKIHKEGQWEETQSRNLCSIREDYVDFMLQIKY